MTQECGMADATDFEILLVEDDENDVLLTLHALRAEGMANNIRVARDGAEALEILGEYERRTAQGTGKVPRLVLLDLKLPKVDGLQVLTWIKANRSTQSIPVVVMTSSREDSDLASAYRLGANSYIQKPVTFEDFRNKVKQLGFYWLLVNEIPTLTALRSNQNMEARDGGTAARGA
jgi:CheY-like chemotaxis protein